MIDASFIISNRSALFEEAAAENSGTTDTVPREETPNMVPNFSAALATALSPS